MIEWETIMHNIPCGGLCVALMLLLAQPAGRQPQTYVVDFIGDRPSAESLAEAGKSGAYARPRASAERPSKVHAGRRLPQDTAFNERR